MRATILLLTIAFSEATIGVFVKLGKDAIPVYTFNFYGLCFAAAFLAVALPLLTRESVSLPRDNWRDTLIIGAFIAAQISVFNLAMTLAPMANVVIFWSVAPFFVFILSALFLGEPARRAHIPVFLVAMTGLAIARPLQGGHMAGNLIALADGLLYAAMITFMRHEGKEEADNDVLWFMIAAALFLAPMPAIFGPGAPFAMEAYPRFGLRLPAILWAAGFGIVSTGVAYLCISLVLRRVDANVYSLVDIITSPIIVATLGFLIFGEVPARTTLAGGALLLAAGAWLTRDMARHGRRRAAHPGQAGPRRPLAATSGDAG